MSALLGDLAEEERGERGRERSRERESERNERGEEKESALLGDLA